MGAGSCDEAQEPQAPAYTATATADARWVLTGWSEGARRMLGYSCAEAVGRPAAELLAGDGPGAGTAAAAPAPASGGTPAPPPPPLPVPAGPGRDPAEALPWSGPVALRHRDGHRLELDLCAYPLLDGGGCSQGWLLTAESQGLRQRKQDREILERTFDQSPFSMWIYDADLRFWRVNEAAARLMEAGEDEVRGRPFETAVPDPSYVGFRERMRQVVRTGEPARHISFLKEGSGQERAWASSIWAARDESDRVCAVTAWGLDMSEEYWARRRLVLLNEASRSIGLTLDMVRTTEELAEVVVPRFADHVRVELLESLFGNGELRDGPAADPVRLRRTAQRSAGGDGPADGRAGADGRPGPDGARGPARPGPEGAGPAAAPAAPAAPGTPGGLAVVECLATGRPSVRLAAEPEQPASFGLGPVLGPGHGPARWPAGNPVVDPGVRAEGFHSVMTVPLIARGTVLGVAVLARGAHLRPFSADDLMLAEELAARTAVCIDNARRFARERAAAITLQRSLLPQRLPGQTAVEVASRYLPAGARAGIGGDWFDVIPLSGARVALVVGDVVGHGLHASASMGRLRTAVRTLAEVDLPPDELLTHLDDLVLHLNEEAEGLGAEADPFGGVPVTDMGATCLYAVYDPVSRRCRAASAGHPAPAVVAPDGTVEFLPVSPGPPLGVGGLPFEAVEVELDEGSLIALYTDGLLEARGRDVDEGLERLRRALAAAHTADPETTGNAVVEDMVPGAAPDDVALLLARTRALAPHQIATWQVEDDPASVPRARKLAAEQLAAWGLDDLTFVVELVVSELVTNAVRYGRPPVRLRLIRDRTLICEVSDSSATAPHLRRARAFDEGGRGLLLVARLMQGWGARQDAGGKTIWAEHPLPPRP
ncbi:SpoIIE family protein phosphatase [Streptomyces thermolineatus]|uniref:SpoIIE family protein phosphatase n=1 Tax=Streptomyces thermolineatus TaxID=44033 RepID=UPI00384D2A0C